MLAAAGRTADSLPKDMRAAFEQGQISVKALQRFLHLDSHWFFKIFMPLQGAFATLARLNPGVNERDPGCRITHSATDRL